MSGTSTKSTMISFRLSNTTVDKIKIALKTPRNPNTSVSDYCKTVIERWVWRHEKK